MNGKQLFQWMNYVDEAYIQEAETAVLRPGRLPVRIVFQVAAVLAVLVSVPVVWNNLVGFNNTGADTAVMQDHMVESEDGAPDLAANTGSFSIHIGEALQVDLKAFDWMDTDIGYAYSEEENFTVFTASEEFEDFISTNRKLFGSENAVSQLQDRFDSAFFGEYDLLTVTLPEASPDADYQIRSIRMENAGHWILTISPNVESVSEGSSPCHIFVSVEKGKLQKEDLIDIHYE